MILTAPTTDHGVITTMKRIISIILAVLMLVSAAAFAEMGVASQLSDEVVFDQAIRVLQHYNQPESVSQAAEIFGTITSNYNCASLFKGYASALAYIHAGDIEGAVTYIQVLGDRSDFDALLAAYNLPPLKDIETYISARRAEAAGNNATAFELYLSLDLFDSFDRAIALRDSGYEARYVAAIALFNQGRYEEAAAAFLELGDFQDSPAWAERCRILATAGTPAPMVTATPEPKNQSMQYAGWEIVQFGSYEQDNDTSNGSEPIEWIVLADDGQKQLLLSLYALDVKPYNKVSDKVTWSNSSLRSWLNGEFLNTAFTAAEQQMIPASAVSNSAKNFFGVDGGQDTKDQVFLLNVNAANSYLTDMNIRLCRVTPYAEQHGARWDGDGYCWWWLRDPGNTRQFAAYVALNGMINDGGNEVACNYICVRPALWVNLNG